VAGLLAEQARVAQCEERVAAAWTTERPRRLLEAIRSGGCSALLSGGPKDVVACRICPAGEAWEYVAGYYRGAKQRVYVCAEKEPSRQQVEDTLTHELVHAYDHCRFGMRLPFVGTQAPWAVTCAAEACSEVRAQLLSRYYAPQGTSLAPGLITGGLASAALARAATSAEAAAVHREPIYLRALEATEHYGTCAREGRDCRALLDAVFNACLADHPPLEDAFGKPPAGFPPMPSEVEAAERLLRGTPPPPQQQQQLPPPPPATHMAAAVEAREVGDGPPAVGL